MILYWRRYGKAGGCQIKQQTSWKAFYIERASRVRRLGANLFQQGSVVLIKLVLPVIRDFNTLRFLMTDKHSVGRLQSVPLSGNCEAISNANKVRYCTLKTSYRRFWWKWFFIKTSENIVNKVYDQTKRTKVQDRSNSIRVIKRKDPVSNAIETVNEVKQKRAQGGCLGTKSRWKTW